MGEEEEEGSPSLLRDRDKDLGFSRLSLRAEIRGVTLVEVALGVLNAADPWEKSELGEEAAILWFQGHISHDEELPVPDRPARLSNVRLVAPHLMPKLGKAGSLQSWQAVLHSLVHTESWAIDLSWDIIARFGRQEGMPRPFFDDFVKVAQDEGRHFRLLAARLEELGSFYGALPAHDDLWDSANATSNSLLARLAVEQCVHEFGGCQGTGKQLVCSCRDAALSSYCSGLPNNCAVEETVPERTLVEEEQSCHPSCGEAELGATVDAFHTTARKYFTGPLKPPFNELAREAAGFGQEWYKPLAVKDGPQVADGH
ncbi:hypothetical protein AMTR_s00040p00233220 [Amborella trichopoda]|uniref:DUF455 domain-containing protein n=1 Tax=Amborella trichopoda TaxID=13333 RepID=W1PYS4_AMBTC|nr:hypothetical protein AMTR_s00040p00233220 [Amborella trichopoda]